ncbi:MAG: MarR family transcriptional regulator [Bradyrhizobium sp.]|jgi:DNA-binding MarR family transcriptional regulator|uniref:MarR family winged helix-turn-helix transcriptional regulator n=1 Tax=Bradyrhizobium sp. TaxID=376 RepID=UPI001A243DAF|nr:MarR family transcriptional regulator [Bradyrhizobium sp.]MBJ7406743.1 MarR family transcriptional regulator [Bradyrhizobium sp.]
MSATRKSRACHRRISDQEVIDRFTWEIVSINFHLVKLRQFWAKALNISGPQWMILLAVSDLDKGDGVPVNAVSKMLQVDSSFVTTQSKRLENSGLLRRDASPTDARVVRMSLTDKCHEQLSRLAARQQAVGEFTFEEFSSDELAEFSEKLSKLKSRMGKACLKLTLDF